MQCNIFHEISSVTTEVNLIQMNSKRRYLLFWNSKQQWFVVSYCCFKLLDLTSGSSSLGLLTTWPLMMVPIGCPKMSVTKYQSTLPKIPEEEKSHLHCRRYLKSSKWTSSCVKGQQWRRKHLKYTDQLLTHVSVPLHCTSLWMTCPKRHSLQHTLAQTVLYQS